VTNAAKPTAYYLAPALLVLGTLLAAGNWYLQPARATAWASALLALGGMTLVFLLASRQSTHEPARRRAAESIGNGIVFAGLMIVVALAVKLAIWLGAMQDAELSRRATMVILGAFFVFTGNGLPKTLTPISALRCDAARVQAIQRFAGWAWVLTGLTFAIAWLALPLDLAQPVSLVLLMGGMFIIAAQVARLRWA
jgi:hypothetical protein